ncbi:helix-turn-helix domain-containing protein [Halobacillus mangrovi]|uniref:helix-turn-helix domain-containing protein n=1 Tax=Halobacillus mangrovi TaxID=402384 RepID=UPI003D979A72
MTTANYELISMLKDCSIAFQTPILLFDHHHKLTYQFPDSFQKPHPLLRENLSPYLRQSENMPYSLQLYSDAFHQQMFLYPMLDERGKGVIIGIGPFLQQEVGRKQVNKLLILHDIEKEHGEAMLDYFGQLPVVNQVHVLALERMLLRVLPHKEEDPMVRNHIGDRQKKAFQFYAHSSPSQKDSYQLKEQFFEAFKKGDEKATDVYQKYKKEFSVSLANGDPVRSEKNHLIRLVAELTQVCLEEGAPRDELFSLSEFYINFLEIKQTRTELLELESNVILSFLSRLKQTKNGQHYSPLVERTQKYIFQYLTENISLKKIAEELNVHPNYLSGVFAKEVGISISQFINKQRIKQAKELLSITRYSLMEISILLGYNSQSYFTRVFKKVEGIGPKEFRDKYHVSEE